MVSPGSSLLSTGAFRMPKSFDVFASARTYPVSVGSNLLAQTIEENSNAIFIVDRILESRLPASITKRIIVEAIEANKSLEYMPTIIQALRKLSADRATNLVAIGGGIIQDITTFVASIYMRGVTWTYMPTTLLSMVDSCIGGKSSINVSGYKNLVGNFYPPRTVFVDTSFVETLDAEMVVGGLFEAAKICYARNYTQFEKYLAEEPTYPLRPDRAERVIVQSLETKKWFIETDEFDQKERLLLNFGHTFGHAMEAASDFRISHGIGVGLGMLVSIEYAKHDRQLTAIGLDRIAYLKAHIKDLLRAAAYCDQENLPIIDLSLVMGKFDHDKKHGAKSYCLIIPSGDGELELTSVPKDDRTRRHVVAAYERALGDVSLAFSSSKSGSLNA